MELRVTRFTVPNTSCDACVRALTRAIQSEIPAVAAYTVERTE